MNIMTINSGDTAWLLVSAALVMFMTPGLAFFYGGMARRKNLLSTLMMSFVMIGIGGLIWVLYGYSLGFGPDIGGFIGNLSFLGLKGVGQTPSAVYASTVPQLAYMMYQGMFAIITVALITGAVVERIKFSSLIVFAVAWLTLIYSPVVHWVWGGGWLAKLGALDFAGGSVVHINAGVSALALAFLLGKRKGFPQDQMEPNNIPLVVLGASILWFGWFGFNAGSALSSGGLASTAFVNTNTAAAAASLTWMFLSWRQRKPAVLGAVTGAVAGLVAITPAAGFVTPMAAIAIGIAVSFVSFYSLIFIKSKLKFDDSLDVFACHGMGGMWGALATGIFATTAVNAAGSGAVDGNWVQILRQLAAVGAVAGFAFVGTLIIGKAIDVTLGLRVKQVDETVGLDISQHGERAYGGLMR
jgi:Amt family ammonium transporter